MSRMAKRRTAIGDLIVEVMASKRLSLNDVANASGGKIGKSRVAGIRDGQFKMVPPRATLEGLARGLGLPYSVVRDAATASLGGARVSDPGDDVAILTAEAEESLTPAKRAQWVKLSRALLESLQDE